MTDLPELNKELSKCSFFEHLNEKQQVELQTCTNKVLLEWAEYFENQLFRVNTVLCPFCKKHEPCDECTKEFHTLFRSQQIVLGLAGSRSVEILAAITKGGKLKWKE